LKENALMIRWATIGLTFFLLVVLAGSVVRSTGSGMGCPDWPKCFGYLIPPTEMHQVNWHPEREYKRGQMIIHNGTLFVAKTSFTTGSMFATGNWEAYSKHNYANFVVHHTWIEFINRLIGALSGLPMLIVVGISWLKFRHRPIIPFLATSGLVILGLVAWLGKVVVDGHLIPGQITIHMLGALLLVFVMTSILGLVKEKYNYNLALPKSLKIAAVGALVLTLLQILLGTQVREQMDEIMLYFKEVNRVHWIEQLDYIFYVHRSFSILLVLINGYVLLKIRQLQIWSNLHSLIAIFLGLEILIGIILAYAHMPGWAQPPHLVVSFLLFTMQAVLVWRVFGVKVSHYTFEEI